MFEEGHTSERKMGRRPPQDTVDSHGGDVNESRARISPLNLDHSNELINSHFGTLSVEEPFKFK